MKRHTVVCFVFPYKDTVFLFDLVSYMPKMFIFAIKQLLKFPYCFKRKKYRLRYARGKSKGDSLRKKRKKYLLKSINRKAEVYGIITFGIGVTLRDGDRQGCRGIHLTNLYKCKIINFEVTYF